MKQIITIALTLIVSVSAFAQTKTKVVKLPLAVESLKKPDSTKVYHFNENQVDSIIRYVQASAQALFRKGSGISLDEANQFADYQQKIGNMVRNETFRLHPGVKRQIDSLNKAKQQK